MTTTPTEKKIVSVGVHTFTLVSAANAIAIVTVAFRIISTNLLLI